MLTGAPLVVVVLVVVGAILWWMRGRTEKPANDRQKAAARVKSKRRVEVEGRVKHIVAFTLDGTDEDELLDVDERTFETLEEGARGILTWEDTRFVRFARD